MGARLGAGGKFLGHGRDHARPILVIQGIDAAGGVERGGVAEGHECHFRRKYQGKGESAMPAFCHFRDENWQMAPGVHSYTIGRSRQRAGQAILYVCDP
ncbi:hypothetical protein D3C71_948060 [compost metagenome]